MDTQLRLRRIQEMLANEPNDPELRYMEAMEFASQGNDEKALGRFVDLIGVAPDYPPAYHQAGRVLQRLGRLPEARDILRRGIPQARQKGDVHAAEEMQGLLESLE